MLLATSNLNDLDPAGVLALSVTSPCAPREAANDGFRGVYLVCFDGPDATEAPGEGQGECQGEGQGEGQATAKSTTTSTTMGGIGTRVIARIRVW